MPISSLNLSNVTKVSGGYGHSLAISDGKLYAWGLNGNGQLGDGTTTNKNNPTQIGTMTDWTDIACGDYHSVAVRNNGAVYAWGKNTLGQCGSSIGGNVLVPTIVTGAGSVAQVAASSDYTLFLNNNGNVYGTGDNTYRTIINSSTLTITTPTLASDLSGATLIAAGPTLCAAARAGGIWVKGTFDFNTAQINYIPANTNGAATLVPNSGSSYYIALDIGNEFLLAIKQDGKLYGYTFKSYNNLVDLTLSTQLTSNTYMPSQQVYPSQAQTPIGAYGIRYYVGGLMSQTTNTWTYRLIPESNELVLINESQNWLRLACGRDHALLTNINGEVYSVGSNSLGQLGRTATGNSTSIAKLESPANTGNWSVIGCGSFHSLLCLSS